MASARALGRIDWKHNAAAAAAILAYGLALAVLAWAVDQRLRHEDVLQDSLVLGVVLALSLGALMEWTLVSSAAVLRRGVTVFEYCGRVCYISRSFRSLPRDEIVGVEEVRRWSVLGPRRYLRIATERRAIHIPAFALDDASRATLLGLR